MNQYPRARSLVLAGCLAWLSSCDDPQIFPVDGGQPAKSDATARADGGAPAPGAWVATVNPTDYHDSSGVALVRDRSGDLFVAGTFYGEARLGDRQLKAVGEQDIFLARYAADGKLRWVKTWGGSDHDTVVSMVLGTAGELYLGGAISTQVDFDGQPARSLSGQNAFVARLDASDGRVRWVRVGASAVDSSVTRLAVGLRGGVYAAGTSETELGFAEAPPRRRPRPAPTASSRVFVVRLGADGKQESLHRPVENTRCEGFVVDGDGASYLACAFIGEVRIDGAVLKSQGGSSATIDEGDGLLLKMAADGRLLWHRVLTGPRDDRFTDLARDVSGEVWAVGRFVGPATFAGQSLAAQGTRGDLLLARLSSDGVLVGARTDGAPEVDPLPLKVTPDGRGGVLVAGRFGGSSWRLGPVTARGAPEGGALFVTRYDGKAEPVWVTTAVATDRGVVTARDVLGSAGQVMTVTGSYLGETTFDGVKTPVGPSLPRQGFVWQTVAP
ncbi:MAG: hypothetical protein IT371_19465 [Deltaproteobacteria bacterium]|nr:hypothetical protein [Deltaproteobacteria bacterium]